MTVEPLKVKEGGDLQAHSKPEKDPEDKVFDRELNQQVISQEHLVIIVGKSAN